MDVESLQTELFVKKLEQKVETLNKNFQKQWNELSNKLYGRVTKLANAVDESVKIGSKVADIKSYFDRVAINFETLIINRGKDSGIVVISLEEYNSLIATNYELSNRTNESRLDSAIDKFRSGKSFSKDLIEE